MCIYKETGSKRRMMYVLDSHNGSDCLFAQAVTIPFSLWQSRHTDIHCMYTAGLFSISFLFYSFRERERVRCGRCSLWKRSGMDRMGMGCEEEEEEEAQSSKEIPFETNEQEPQGPAIQRGQGISHTRPCNPGVNRFGSTYGTTTLQRCLSSMSTHARTRIVQPLDYI